MEQSPSPLPEYDNPPLIEVVFGAQFRELEGLKAPHIGDFWDKIGRNEYPELKEMPPLAHIVEQYGKPSPKSPGMTVTTATLPPLARIFFVSKEQDRLIQLQKDRLLQNWRKLKKNGEYPRYERLFPQFVKSWDMFRRFVKDRDLGELEPDQYELTYVNHIECGSGWTDEHDIEEVFPWFKCRLDGEFLDVPEEVAWRRTYRLPDETGRLHIEMKKGLRVGERTPVLVLNLTARGFATGDLNDWFDLAHEWIVRSFADLAGPSIQKEVWRKRK